MILEGKNINTYYGSAHIIYDATFHIKEGEVVCLLGRNGAGKTTLFRSIIGLTPPHDGYIFFKGEDITKVNTFEIIRKGIGYVPEDREIFPTLTTRDNLEIAQRKKIDSNWDINSIFKNFPLLKNLENRKGNALSGGEQQILSIARALMGNPKLLVLDEPTKGVAPKIIEELIDVIKDIKRHTTILLAEQNANFAFAISDRAYILNKGRIVYENTIKELKDNDTVQEKYLSLLSIK
jgi:branched-chain amino acid transport system ATP-binding protein